jgi:hypothetical protein
LALSDEKGETETTPKPRVKELLLQGQEGAYLVSSSNPIENSTAAYEQTQPPHVQAKNCYERHLRSVDGAKFLVTMAEPTTSAPEPIVFEIGDSGLSRKKETKSALATITSSPAPRAG